MQYKFEYQGNTYLFDKDESDKDKYVVFSCAKNEEDYIIEWVEHNLSIGFDKVIIADNNDDNVKLPSLLSKYVEDGTVQIFDCHGLKGIQLYIYDMFLAESNYRWCAYFDCDEFFEMSVYRNIKEFLAPMEEYDCVSFNWLLFGPNGNMYKQPGGVRERFPVPLSPVLYVKENVFMKSIVKGGEGRFPGCWFNGSHIPTTSERADIKYSVGGYNEPYEQNTIHAHYPPSYKFGYIRHYYTKSFEEWLQNKVKRGWPDEMPDLLKAENYFILDNGDEFKIDKYIKGLFVDNTAMDTNKEDLARQIGDNRIVLLKSTERNTYALILEAFFIMKNFTGKVIVFEGDYVDDAMYAAFVEYGVRTGNDVAYIFKDEEFRNILKKYNGGSTFYWINCL